MKKVSVLIPTYRRKRETIRAIESTLNQSYQNIEIIVVDNHSNDGTYETICDYYHDNEKVKVYCNNENLGPVGNWRVALSHASGDYVKLVFSDDWMTCDSIEKCISVLEEHPNSGFVYTMAQMVDDYESPIELMYTGISGEYEKDRFIHALIQNKQEVPFSPMMALFRKDCFFIAQSISNPYGEDYTKTGAGIDMLVYLKALGIYDRYCYLSEPLNVLTCHSTSLSALDNIPFQYDSALFLYMKEAGLFNHYRNQFFEGIIQKLTREGRETGEIEQYCHRILDEHGVNITEISNRYLQLARNERERNQKRRSCIYEVLFKWTKAISKGKRIGDYLQANGINKVGVYGLGRLGYILIDHLIDEGVAVAFCSDIDEKKRIDFERRRIDERWDEADLVINTVVHLQEEIATVVLQHQTTPFISLERVIDGMFWNISIGDLL